MHHSYVNPDTAAKMLLRNHQFYSEFVRLALNADTVQCLSMKDSEETTALPTDHHTYLGLTRSRDLLREVCVDGQKLLVEIENQRNVDDQMVYRQMSYDMLTYQNQLLEMKHNQRHAMTGVISLVFYHGERKWYGKTCLSKALGGIPESLRKYFNDYRLMVIDVKEIKTEDIRDQTLKSIIEAIQKIYAYKGKPEALKGITLEEEYAMMVGSMTSVPAIAAYIRKRKNKGGKVNMCEAFDYYTRKAKKQSYNAGKIQGYAYGQAQTVMTLLSQKLEELSQATMEKLQSCSVEQTERLIHAFSSIHTEEDVLQIIA